MYVDFADLSIGDLSGSVTTVRASPLVGVTMEFKDPQTIVDLEDDRKCHIDDDITLLWYDITVNSDVCVHMCCVFYLQFHCLPMFLLRGIAPSGHPSVW